MLYYSGKWRTYDGPVIKTETVETNNPIKIATLLTNLSVI
jgi:hypothetical protein